jgi:HSP20 family protein
MTHVRFNNRNCMPARPEYQTSQNLMNWFWNDFENGSARRSVPLSNIVETKDDFRIELLAPGYTKSEFKIKLDGPILNISAENVEGDENKDENFVRHEFSRNAFSRSFRLSSWVDSASITAKYENGILFVTIPKVEEAKAKSAQEIEIA